MKLKLTALTFFAALITMPGYLFSQDMNSVEGDHRALMDLYHATDGPNWHNNKGWGGSAETMGDWWGVATDSDGRVIHLDLQRGTKSIPADNYDPDNNPGNGLINAEEIGDDLVLIKGRELPESIGNLKRLRYLNLKQNGLRGPIPSSITKLTNLERLLLSGQTREPGTRPQDANHPATGVTVSGKEILATNRFDGSIPENIGNMQSLVVFQADQSELSGTLPASMSNLTNLKNFMVGSNNLEGSIEPVMIPSLVHLHASNNNFSGAIPSAIGNTQLSQIYASNNNFSGEIPPALGNLTDLWRVLFGGNNLTGPFPIFLFDEVDFTKNNSLISLNLSRNSLSGTIPDTINAGRKEGAGHTNHWALNVLRLDQNNFSGPVPNWMSQFRLIQFELWNNNFQGDLPAGFHDPEAPIYDRLRYMQVQNNSLTGPLPSVPFKTANTSGTPRLWRLAFQDNAFTGPIPSEWGDIVTTRDDFHIYVWNNQLSGEIPVGIASIDGLYRLNVSENKFKSKDIDPILKVIPSQVIFDYSNQNPDDSSGGDDAVSPPAAPQLTSPESGEEDVATAATFTWQQVSDADQYRFQLSDSGDPFNAVTDRDGLTGTQTTVNSLKPASTYYWRVRASNSSGTSEWSRVRSFTTESDGSGSDGDDGDSGDEGSGSDGDDDSGSDSGGDDAFNAPLQLSPGEGSKNVRQPVSFEWESVNADHYILEVVRSGSGTSIANEQVSGTSHTLSDELAPETSYQWRVRAVKDGVESEWTSYWEFTTRKENGPKQSSPSNGSQKTSKNPNLSWESDDDADYYSVEVSESAGEVVAMEEVYDTTYTPPQELKGETTYHWRVRAVKDGEPGDWSDTWEFTTEPDLELTFEVELEQNYPNPFNPTTHIRFTLSAAQSVSLKVYDLAGRQVATIVDGMVPAGSFNETFNAAGLASGIYFYRLITETEIVTRKMTLMK